jgi:hypothetical protein
MGSVRFNEVPEKVWEASVQRQVRFNRVPEKVPGRFQRRFRRRSGRAGRLWGCGARPRCFQRLASQYASEKIVKIKRCGCWGYRQSFFDIEIFIHRNMFFHFKQEYFVQQNFRSLYRLCSHGQIIEGMAGNFRL